MRVFALAQVVVGLIAGVAFLVRAFLSGDSVVKKEQSRIMLVGIAAGVLPLPVFSIGTELLGLGPALRPEITVLAMVLVPGAFAYAIMRHQLMGIRRFVHRGTAYALISIVVLVVYGALIGISRTAGGSDVSSSLTF